MMTRGRIFSLEIKELKFVCSAAG